MVAPKAPKTVTPKTVTVKANVNVAGLTAGHTGELPDDDETRALLDQGLIEEVKDAGSSNA